MLTENEQKIFEKTTELLKTLKIDYPLLPEVGIEFRDLQKRNGGKGLHNTEKHLYTYGIVEKTKFGIKIIYDRNFTEKGLQFQLDNTVPHEVAHVVRMWVFNDKTHQADWKVLCKQLGGSGKAQDTVVHIAETVYAKKPLLEETDKVKFYKYKDPSTSREVWVSRKIHVNIQRNKNRYKYVVSENIVSKEDFTTEVAKRTQIKDKFLQHGMKLYYTQS